MRRQSLPFLTAALLIGVLPAAQGHGVEHADGPVRHFDLDYATGAIVESSSRASSVRVFSNTTQSSTYAILRPQEEWLDWGVKAGGASGVVTKLSIGYATNALDPLTGGPGAEIELAFFQGTGSGGVFGTEVFRTRLRNLPGGVFSTARITLSIDLTSAPFSLTDGPIGWSYKGIDGLTGPLLIRVGVDPTSTVDQLYGFRWAGPASVFTGAFSFTMPGVASLYMGLDEGTSLIGTPGQLSLSAGGTQTLSIDLGPSGPFRSYQVLGSFAGVVPGMAIGSALIPLNVDAYLTWTLLNPNTPLLAGSFGVLDITGRATATLSLPPATDAALAGLTVHHAGFAIDFSPAGVLIPAVTNPVPLQLVP